MDYIQLYISRLYHVYVLKSYGCVDFALIATLNESEYLNGAR